MTAQQSLTKESEMGLTGEKLIFLLPVDHTVKPLIRLQVTIPKGYQPIQPPATWEYAPLIEFIPQGEKPNSYSEIITVQTIVGQKISASFYISRMKQGITRAAKNVKVWKYVTERNERGSTVSMLGLSYDFN